MSDDGPLAVVHGMPPALQAEVQSMIDGANAGSIPPLTAYMDIIDMLEPLRHVKDEVLLSKRMATHPSNRGGGGLNPHNVHKNGLEIVKIGTDPKELVNAAAFQLCPMSPQKDIQLNFNKKLISSSKGLLAPLTGSEDHLTVSAGHFTAWVRAVQARCRTPFKELQSADGSVSMDIVAKDRRMNNMIKHGWSVKVFSWQCEVAWPQLPDLCQRALNASHGVSSRSTELEIMLWIAENSDETGLEESVSAARGNAPSCSQYLDQVGKLALQLAGAHFPWEMQTLSCACCSRRAFRPLFARI